MTEQAIQGKNVCMRGAHPHLSRNRGDVVCFFFSPISPVSLATFGRAGTTLKLHIEIRVHKART